MKRHLFRLHLSNGWPMELHIILSGNILSCLRRQEELNNGSPLQRTFCGVYHNLLSMYLIMSTLGQKWGKQHTLESFLVSLEPLSNKGPRRSYAFSLYISKNDTWISNDSCWNFMTLWKIKDRLWGMSPKFSDLKTKQRPHANLRNIIIQPLNDKLPLFCFLPSNLSYTCFGDS